MIQVFSKSLSEPITINTPFRVLVLDTDVAGQWHVVLGEGWACWIHDELEREWKWLVHHGIGATGSDSPTVQVFWEIIIA